MGLRHRTLDVEGVQFHPESILTGHGKALLGNWLRPRAGREAAVIHAGHRRGSSPARTSPAPRWWS